MIKQLFARTEWMDVDQYHAYLGYDFDTRFIKPVKLKRY